MRNSRTRLPLIWGSCALALSVLAVPTLLGCGGGSYRYAASDALPAESPPQVMVDQALMGGGGAAEPEPAPEMPTAAAYEMADSDGGESVRIASTGGEGASSGPSGPPPPVDDRLPTHPGAPSAQRDPQLAQNTAGQPTSSEQSDARAPDPRELIIYTATLYLGVYDVSATQDAIIEGIRGLDGFLMRRTDRGLVVRVPARRFRDAIGAVGEHGDVLRRDISAQDVSEEFRDVQVRLRNAEVLRARLERLLERADSVEDALQIERELQRLTTTIETLRGRQRYLADRISFSTITIHFTPLATESNDTPHFRLPFPWLDRLGLQNLTRL